jgi:hypothetical protein
MYVKPNNLLELLKSGLKGTPWKIVLIGTGHYSVFLRRHLDRGYICGHVDSNIESNVHDKFANKVGFLQQVDFFTQIFGKTHEAQLIDVANTRNMPFVLRQICTTPSAQYSFLIILDISKHYGKNCGILAEFEKAFGEHIISNTMLLITARGNSWSFTRDCLGDYWNQIVKNHPTAAKYQTKLVYLDENVDAYDRMYNLQLERIGSNWDAFRNNLYKLAIKYRPKGNSLTNDYKPGSLSIPKLVQKKVIDEDVDSDDSFEYEEEEELED